MESKSLVPSDFTANLERQYAVLAAFAETNLVNKWLGKSVTSRSTCYSSKANEDADMSRKFFVPEKMIVPSILRTSCRCFGHTPSKTTDFYYQKSRSDHISAFYDILHLFWIGFFQFLKALNTNDSKILTSFITEATSLVRVPVSGNGDSQVIISQQNKADVLVAFVGIYALHLLMTPETTISTRCRIEGLKLWVAADPEFKFAEFHYSRWYDDTLDPHQGRPNILPSSFNPGHLPDQVYNTRDIQANSRIKELFGNPFVDSERLASGFKSMLTNHKAELIQVAEGFMRLRINSAEKYFMRLLAQILQLDDGTLGLIFGEKASYRNKGMVSEITDELNHLGAEALRLMVVELRKKNQSVEKELANEHRSLRTMTRDLLFLRIWNNGGDHKGYFTILGFTISQPYSTIKPLLEFHYRHLSLQYHPDKTGDGRLQTQLNEAVEVFRNESKFNRYLEECKSWTEGRIHPLFP